MLRFVCSLLFVFLSGAALATPFESALSPGQYQGVFNNEKIRRSQYVSLDLIQDPLSCQDPQSDSCRYMAILKLFLGEPGSDEYVSYHFEDLDFNESEKTLALFHPDQEISILLKKTGTAQLSGILRSSFGGDCGEVVLELPNEEKLLPLQYPHLNALAGEYEGTCENGQLTRLQIYTYRSTEDTSKIGNPFASFKLYSNWAYKDRSLCFEKSEFCIMGVFDKGTYNFFENDLMLMGPKRNVACKALTDGLICGQCQLLRTKAMPSPPISPSKKSKKPFSERVSVRDSSSTDWGGVYRGYLYHEGLDLYQLAEVNLRDFNTGSQRKLSANAHLYFGEYEKKESISYRFETLELDVQSPRKQFILSRPDADLDAVIEVTEIGEGIMRGIWYSLLFGRVGPFELHQEKPVQIPEKALMMKSLSGFYSGDLWDLNLVVELGQTPLNSDNPFHPLTFSGWAKIQELGFRVTVLDGSYDFYTGKLGLVLSHPSLFAGVRTPSGEIFLRKPGHLVGTVLKDWDLIQYEFVSSEHPF